MPRRAHTSAERAEARAQIVAAARSIYAEGGLRAVTMRAVAARQGCSAGAIYRHFPGRVQLVQAMWEDALASLTVMIEGAATRHAAPVDAIRAVLGAYAAFACEQPVAFASTFLQLWEPSPERLVLADPLSRPPYSILRDLAAEACRRGALRPIDADLCAQVLWGAVHGALALSRNLGDFPFAPVPQRVDAVVAATLRGLSPD